MRASSASLIFSLAAAGVSAENPPYLGCIAPGAEGFNRPLVLNIANYQKVKASPSLCKRFCQENSSPDYPLFASDNYSCYCGFRLSPGAKFAPDSLCSNKCSGDDSATCGGSKAFSLYGDEQFVTPPGYLAGLTDNKCYQSDQSKFTGPKYTDATNMTVNSCARFCVGKHGKYGITLDMNNTCYCTDDGQDMGKELKDREYTCNHACPGDKRQDCGGGNPRYGDYYVSHWKFVPQ
ncbi:hypothetical protein QQS21_002998 [Conoideocrella luteorostrata]|uniref:WSC domain-containing protein n=1 Tax=Conoideocrella luteorostrata TaxID=1105319 RepID=A0AAJ0CU53_9HYPO|nr:hypothetical protein QQS21_002998 [Conoideocrella luteorostrata]